MGRLDTKSDYESIRNARILENQARLASMGLHKMVSDLRCMSSSAKTQARKRHKFDYGCTPQRRSARLIRIATVSTHTATTTSGPVGPISPNKGKLMLSGKSEEFRPSDGEEKCPVNSPLVGLVEVMEDTKEAARRRLDTKSDYESIRNARVLENQARLASLGLHKTVLELRLLTSSAKSVKRKYNKVDYRSSTPRRCSPRLNGTVSDSTPKTATPTGQHVPLWLRQLRGTASGSAALISKHKGNLEPSGKSEEVWHEEGEEKRFASAPLVRLGRGEGMKAELSPEILAQRCASKNRGSIYDPVYGICCHFCRQKKLCGEEDCRRCGNLDIDEPCIGKTECSACHSSNGVLCRACLKVRYGEEMEDVRRNEQWMCPHCIEDKGINLFWICNSSLCLRKRKMSPTGIAIFRARQMGYKSVAHLLMDELQQAKCR